MGALRVSVDAALRDWQRCDGVGSPTAYAATLSMIISWKKCARLTRPPTAVNEDRLGGADHPAGGMVSGRFSQWM
jgi:hypothetical protein